MGLKTLKSMFVIKFEKIGHFWPNYGPVRFDCFWSKKCFFYIKNDKFGQFGRPMWPISYKPT